MNVGNSSTLDRHTSPLDFDPKGPLRVPDYMEPTIFRSSGLPEIDDVLKEVRRILQGEEPDPSPGEGNKTASPVPQPRPVEQSAPEPDQPVRYYQVLGSDSRLVVLVDFGDTAFEEESRSAEYLFIVEALRTSGREIPANRVAMKLKSPDELEINLYSLQEMARFLLRHRDYACPIVGTDPQGIIQIEWRFDGNGLLVVAFLGEETVHCVALSDATPEREELDESVRLSTDALAETFGELIPKK